MDAQEPIGEARPPERRKGPNHARRRRSRGEKRRHENAYTGPERRQVDHTGDAEHACPGVDALWYAGAERRTGAERRESQRRSGTDRREGASWRERTDLRAVATRARTLLSAVALSMIAAVGSYSGTYRVMEMLFVPDVVTPIAAPVPPGQPVAHADHEVARVEGSQHRPSADTSGL